MREQRGLADHDRFRILSDETARDERLMQAGSMIVPTRLPLDGRRSGQSTEMLDGRIDEFSDPLRIRSPEIRVADETAAAGKEGQARRTTNHSVEGMRGLGVCAELTVVRVEKALVHQTTLADCACRRTSDSNRQTRPEGELRNPATAMTAAAAHIPTTRSTNQIQPTRPNTRPSAHPKRLDPA